MLELVKCFTKISNKKKVKKYKFNKDEIYCKNASKY